MSDPRLTHGSLSSLEHALGQHLEGEIDFGPVGIAINASDASNYRQLPLGVVYPRNDDELIATLALCREHDCPVLMRGAGTSQNGQCVNRAVVVDCSRHLGRVLEIDPERREALVQPGLVCDHLNAAAAEHGLMFGPDPATHSRCTLGGMIGNNSCGPHSMLAGKTVENVLELEVVSGDGERLSVGPSSDAELQGIIGGTDRRASLYRELKAIRDAYATEIRTRYPSIKRRVSGYNLDQLLPENGFNVARALVGSEGTCATVLAARVRLIERPLYRRLLVLGFADIFEAADAVAEILPFEPIAMEGLDWGIVGGLVARKLQSEAIALLPNGRAWLMVEFGGNDGHALDRRMDDFERRMQSLTSVIDRRRAEGAAETRALWGIRELGASATAMSLDPAQPDPVVGWEDTAVDPLQLGAYLREFQALIDRFGYTTCLYGHFGDGCIHARITFDTRSESGVHQWRQFSEALVALIVAHGGSLSGEHGDGQAKAEFLPQLFGDELMQAFRRFKLAWDPARHMNPGKLIDAWRMDENLRYGPDYRRPRVDSVMTFVNDPGGLGRASERCIGMGRCRADDGAMCPSYQITREERYSTRGRAHLLHELLRGEVFERGWKDLGIADSLDFCLSCKACKSECPTAVDIASYKSEFMYRHHRDVRRPFSHYPLGHIGTLLPRLSPMASTVNVVQKSPIGRFMQRRLGFHRDARLPELASPDFHRWSGTHADRFERGLRWFGRRTGTPVVLWADTFNSHFRPWVLEAAIRVLCRSGHQVALTIRRFCCGRPLYEYGYLDQARLQLEQILVHFLPTLPADTSIVVLEPACLSVFRDELGKLFPDDRRARQLANRTRTLASFMSRDALSPERKLDMGIYHAHCHAQADGEASTDQSFIRALFVELDRPESGCCGMAGVYGLRDKTRSVGNALYARRLGARIESADPDAVLVTDGFSCAKQMNDHTNRPVLHPAEIMDHCM